ncbi:tripartite tricarboxylate transporter permease [Salipaludibacillus sp. CF4.18]|uniref:tripartite tricarboxylate transporter permease n=1 Tax=Salipaludibacillus sp. CF4.18 TaxID=3373081 RepID=UPI003EE6BE9A
MDYIWHVFEVYHILILFLGLFLGILVGALPGLTPTMGVALMIPFTFSLGPTDGLILLGAIYCGSVFGGSIPTILFNVPGAPASVATTFDGYPMAQSGKARKALELAVISSVVGGLFGMFLLIFFAPAFTRLSLQFGPSETFWIAIFGITVIAAISDGSINRNLIGGAFGILLSFIGISTVTGTTRFTFGFESFVGGLHIVAVLIGLFAFPQALRLIESLRFKEKKGVRKELQEKSTIKQSFADVFKTPKSVSLGSVIGAVVGIVPGAGGNIASILAYNEVKRFSKNKKNFGKGEKKGVIASESANNAMVGASLIPLLTLGIPGSPTAAIFLGGLLIHGIWPGQNLFIDNAEVAYVFLYSMVAAQLVLLIVGLAMIKYMTRLTSIPSHVMAPVILSFSIIGAYTTQNNSFDIHTVVILGCLMFFLQKHRFSPAPIALGFILGSIAEEGLLQGLQVGGASGSQMAYFFTGSWNIILYSLVMLTITMSVIQVVKKKNQPLKPSKERKHVLTKQYLFSFSSVLWIGTILVTILSTIYLFKFPFEHRIFPQVTLLLIVVFTVLEYFSSSRQVLSQLKTNANKSKIMIIFPLLVLVSIVSLLTNQIGYYTQVFILMMIVPLYVHLLKWQTIQYSRMIIISISFTVILYIVFKLILKVPLNVFPMF